MSLLSEFLAITSGWRSVSPPNSAPLFVAFANPGIAGLPGAALPHPHHLDQRRPEQLVERGIFPPLALPLGAATVVPPHSQKCFGILPPTPGRRGH